MLQRYIYVYEFDIVILLELNTEWYNNSISVSEYAIVWRPKKVPT